MNQCDGCRRGLPIKDGNHYDPRTGWVYMGCEKSKYESPCKVCPDTCYYRRVEPVIVNGKEVYCALIT
jgi:hypothetical protein